MRDDFKIRPVGTSARVASPKRSARLVAGSDQDDDHRAVIATLFETCKLDRLDPWAWAIDALSRLAAGHALNRLCELMPWNGRPCS